MDYHSYVKIIQSKVIKRISMLIFLLSTICFSSIGQKRNCKSLQLGKFRLDAPKSGTTIITRQGNIQLEEGDGFKISYSTKWINDCTCELRFKKLYKGDSKLKGGLNDIITFQILDIKQNSYLVKTTANFTDLALTREIKILK